MPSSECANISFLALARHACERAHVHGQTDRTRRSETACRTFLQLGIMFSNANIYPQDMRTKRAGRPHTSGLHAGFPRFPPHGACQATESPKTPQCEVLTRFPRPLTLPAPFGLTVLRTYARTRRRSSRPSQRERRPRCVPLFAEQLYKNLRSDQKPT